MKTTKRISGLVLVSATHFLLVACSSKNDAISNAEKADKINGVAVASRLPASSVKAFRTKATPSFRRVRNS